MPPQAGIGLLFHQKKKLLVLSVKLVQTFAASWRLRQARSRVDYERWLDRVVFWKARIASRVYIIEHGQDASVLQCFVMKNRVYVCVSVCVCVCVFVCVYRVCANRVESFHCRTLAKHW